MNGSQRQQEEQNINCMDLAIKKENHSYQTASIHCQIIQIGQKIPKLNKNCQNAQKFMKIIF